MGEAEKSQCVRDRQPRAQEKSLEEARGAAESSNYTEQRGNPHFSHRQGQGEYHRHSTHLPVSSNFPPFLLATCSLFSILRFFLSFSIVVCFKVAVFCFTA